MDMNRVHLAAESFGAGNGGMARVARLIARVLGEQVRDGRLGPAAALSLNDPERPADLGVPARTARGSRARFVAANQWAAARHSHFIYDFVGMARAHCRLPGLRRPFLTYIHGVEIWEDARPDRVRWARRADALLVNSAYTRERAGRCHGGFGEARVCWLGTEHDDDAPAAPPDRDGPPTVLVVGRIDVRRDKGHGALIRAWPDVRDAVPGARLLIAGRGPGLDALRQQAATTRGGGGGIEFLGFVPDERVDELWARADVFAMPSRGEGFGLVYIEAMRHGVPVIGSVHDAAPEVNLDGQTGYNVNLDRDGELTERLVPLLRDPGAARALGAAGRRRWREEFCYSAFRRRFLPHLETFLGM
jgi:phosphatidylinositol alpha-1,6-mannosyltransferase